MKRIQAYLVEVEETARFAHLVMARDRGEAKAKALADHKKGAPVGKVSGVRVSKVVCAGVPGPVEPSKGRQGVIWSLYQGPRRKRAP